MKASIAGKVFLLGEYAVLTGAPALLASIAPRFQIISGKGILVTPKSPLDRLIQWGSAQSPDAEKFLSNWLQTHQWLDPYEGAGGFGASTAQFALAYFALSQFLDLSRRWKDVWSLYRELHSNEALIPSGADLVAQWQGGVTCFEPSAQSSQDLWPLLSGFGSATHGTAGISLLVFSATQQKGRKVATHEHLSKLGKIEEWDRGVLKALEETTLQGVNAIREGVLSDLGLALTNYAEILQRAGWEIPATTEDRKVLSQIPGVLGVKGTGALQSDAILGLVELGVQAQVVEIAEKRGLKLIADRLTCQMGIGGDVR